MGLGRALEPNAFRLELERPFIKAIWIKIIIIIIQDSNKQILWGLSHIQETQKRDTEKYYVCFLRKLVGWEYYNTLA